MKLSLLFFAPFALLFSQSLKLYAQFENIDLNNYKLTDFKYKTLSTSLNANNTYGYANATSTNQFNNSNSNLYQNSLGSSGNLGYSSTTYCRKYIGNQNLGLNFNSNFDKSSSNDSFDNFFDNNNFSSKSSSYYSSSNFSLNLNSNNRFYMSNDFFIGINLQSYQSPNHSYSKSKSTSNTSTHTNNLSSSHNYYNSINAITLQFGKGRYEDVTDARLAIYILNDLAKQGRLARTPSQEEVFAFADFITKTLNKRVIDSRIKKIKEYVAVDSFLVSNGLSSKTDGLYFGVINDNWNYGRNQNWETGKAWHIGVSPALNYQNLFYKRIDSSAVSTMRNKLFEYGLGFDAGYSSSWISGLKWTKGYSIRGAFNISKYDSSGHFSEINNHKIITGNANYFITYIPSTRTSITCSSSITFIKQLNKGVNNEMRIIPAISGSCNYYFSEKFRMQINANINYKYNKIYDFTNTSKSINFLLNVTLQYYIF
ncbi:MAG: hypothetical protein HXX16_18635 [Bacteroidales bacterium]|nr:hypothetical protein [Bacteroidales bacterium]